jgi:hypothetical protein
MATYPIKMLRDENQEPFVPMVSADSIYMNDGKSFEEKLAGKIGVDNLAEGTGINIETKDDITTISVDFGASDNIIDNLDTTVAGQGPLDARQGNVLKNMIPTIVDGLDSTDATKVLSANQGRELKEMSVPTGGSIGQVLKKASNNDHELEWGDAADPNAIVGDGTIMSIVELTYEDYKTLEATGGLKSDTEYHITDVENGTATYLTTNQIQTMIEDNVINNTTSSESTKSLSAAQGQKLQTEINQLKDWQYTPSQLIAEVTATGFVPVLKIDNLDLGPGTYEIVYAEYSSAASGPGHVLRLNGATSGYQGIHMHPVGLSASETEGKWRIAYHGNGLAYVNGWDHGTQLCYGTYTLHYFNKDWITVTGQSHLTPAPDIVPSGGKDGEWNILFEQGCYNGHTTRNITSISIEPLDSTTIGTGSYIRLYKK